MITVQVIMADKKLSGEKTLSGPEIII